MEATPQPLTLPQSHPPLPLHITTNNEIIVKNNMKINLPQTILSTSQHQQQQQQLYQQRHIFLTNQNYNKNLTSTPTTATTKLPNFSNNIYQSAKIGQSQTTTIIAKPSIVNSNNKTILTELKQQQQPSHTNIRNVNNKRAKEDLSSNSSSSDEEEQQKQQKQQQSNLKLLLTTNSSSSSSSHHAVSSFSLPKQISAQQTHITPVVSANNPNIIHCPTIALTRSVPSSSIIDSSSSSSSEILNSSSPSSSTCSQHSSSSLKSQKSSIDSDFYDTQSSSSSSSSSKFTSSTSLSVAASPSSSFTTNESSNIDLHDDNSSSASSSTTESAAICYGPRQPGFDLHAHSLIVNNTNEPALSALRPPAQKSAQKSQKSSQKQKTVNSEHINALLSAASNTIKSKKKFCSMQNDSLLMLNGGENNNYNNELTATVATTGKLKPISNKAKREPLPMRLRALPMSFWQQPNQPNVSPGTMYLLPPLFKNEIDNVEETKTVTTGLVDDDDQNEIGSSDANNNYSGNSTANATLGRIREIRISKANTDLLFKLFDNIEQREKKKLNLKMNKNSKLNRNQMCFKPMIDGNGNGATMPLNVNINQSLSKALIKGEDPCILNAVSDDLFPLLRLDSNKTNNSSSTATTPTLSSTTTTLTNTLLTSNHLISSNNCETVNLLAFKSNESSLISLNSNGLSNSSPILSFAANNTGYLSSNFINFSNSNHNLAAPIFQYEPNYSQELSEVVAAL